MENKHKDNMSQQLDAQILELEQRFNQFLKELEEDFDFVPSAVANKNHKGNDNHEDESEKPIDHSAGNSQAYAIESQRTVSG